MPDQQIFGDIKLEEPVEMLALAQETSFDPLKDSKVKLDEAIEESWTVAKGFEEQFESPKAALKTVSVEQLPMPELA
jgi:hypothetical protein